jgi:hypothetical protein
MALQMKRGDIDTYIATFDNLLAKAGWTRGEEAADFFQKGLRVWGKGLATKGPHQG